MWNLESMVQMNIFTKQKLSHRCINRKQTYGYQEGKGGINWEIEIDIYTLLYIKITNKDLLCSTGNSTQYSVKACMGKESKKEWIYV